MSPISRLYPDMQRQQWTLVRLNGTITIKSQFSQTEKHVFHFWYFTFIEFYFDNYDNYEWIFVDTNINYILTDIQY